MDIGALSARALQVWRRLAFVGAAIARGPRSVRLGRAGRRNAASPDDVPEVLDEGIPAPVGSETLGCKKPVAQRLREALAASAHQAYYQRRWRCLRCATSARWPLWRTWLVTPCAPLARRGGAGPAEPDRVRFDSRPRSQSKRGPDCAPPRPHLPAAARPCLTQPAAATSDSDDEFAHQDPFGHGGSTAELEATAQAAPSGALLPYGSLCHDAPQCAWPPLKRLRRKTAVPKRTRQANGLELGERRAKLANILSVDSPCATLAPPAKRARGPPPDVLDHLVKLGHTSLHESHTLAYSRGFCACLQMLRLQRRGPAAIGSSL
jgi:hypothetical protein